MVSGSPGADAGITANQSGVAPSSDGDQLSGQGGAHTTEGSGGRPTTTHGGSGGTEHLAQAGTGGSVELGGAGGTNHSSGAGGTRIDNGQAGMSNREGGMACPGFEERDPSLFTTCSTNQDCTGGATCEQAQIFIESPRPPCIGFGNYCDETVCEGVCRTDECGGQYCEPLCDETVCTGTVHCVDNLCTQKSCDMEGALPCAEGRRCEPGEVRADALGCVWILCDEPDSLGCTDTQLCDPDSDYADGIGCAPLECDDAGGPACPENTVCQPDSVFASKAAASFGCAPIRCDEAGGPSCGEDQVCLPDASRANAVGCTPTPCDMGWQCDPWRSCAPLAGNADPHGCAEQACTVHEDCGCGYCLNEVCRPEQGICVIPEIIATPYGCVWPDDEFV